MILEQIQYPIYKIFHTGDCIKYTLELSEKIEGKAFLRTTITNAKIRQKELIERVELNTFSSGNAWEDFEMEQLSDKVYSITLPLIECGVFESKCFFKREDNSQILWTSGDNFFIKVESAYNKIGNTLYCAFVRQFNFDGNLDKVPSVELDSLDSKGYTVIPKSGTFRQLKSKLDFIVNDLKCQIIQLLPIHPIPNSYAKMGRFGSPFASLDYFSVEPSLADFDTSSSPMEQFIELVDSIHAKHARIFLDIPVNHTGWSSKLQLEHPEYFVRDEKNNFVSPGAWGVVWADLCKLDYNKKEMYNLMAKVFLFWCNHGVDGFRCDAGYMVPKDAWIYIVAKVREQYPNTVFMLEGLGGPVDVQNSLLSEANLDWAYSELFQNYDKSNIINYSNYMNYISHEKGTLVNFAETHDNDRLAKKGKKYSIIRCAVNALLSNCGAFGFANGVEFLADEKIDVHENSDLKWDNPDNIVEELARLNSILQIHHSFLPNSKVEFLEQKDGNALCFKRISPVNQNDILVVMINLSVDKDINFEIPKNVLDSSDKFYDLFKEKSVELNNSTLNLASGEVLILSNNIEYKELIKQHQNNDFTHVPIIRHQYGRDIFLKAYTILNDCKKIPNNLDIDSCVERFLENPESILKELTNNILLPVVNFSVENDRYREIICGIEKLIVVKSSRPFFAEIIDKKHRLSIGKSIKLNDGQFLAILELENFCGENYRNLTINVTKFAKNNKIIKFKEHIIQVSSNYKKVNSKFHFSNNEITNSLMSVHVNKHNSLMQMRAKWGELYSKYDSILSANCNNEVPVDRKNMFLRLRAWLVLNDFSQELNFNLQKSFISSMDNISEWVFEVPTGQGAKVQITIRIALADNANAAKIDIFRHYDHDTRHLAPEIPVKIILRPDVDDRISHELTNAYGTTNGEFTNSLKLINNHGFEFGRDNNCRLNLTVDRGNFVREDEWNYMYNFNFEEYYGLGCKSDIYSPGYFNFTLSGNEFVTLKAIVKSPNMINEFDDCNFTKSLCTNGLSFKENLTKSIRHFIVKRDNYYTIIAGYPWFLDWGRDTLIALRGVISYGFIDEAKDIIMQFAKFEKSGTIPNMIRGNDDSNRDTSDAPLWLFVAVMDYIDKVGDDKILTEKIDGTRNLRHILISIVENYISGTLNGIKCDLDTFLVASPSHFTWMDTNYPAATPRKGYAIEIQALWYNALCLLGRYVQKYSDMAEQVKSSFNKYFFNVKHNCFSDCLHIEEFGTKAENAIADDHIRPNQLLAVTLKLVTDRDKQLNILKNCEQLLIAGAIRSLADKEVDYKLGVYHHGKLLNNPNNPYYGRYNGPEDTERKVAYHNGTAWGWMFPSYMEAMYIIGGENSRIRALMLLLSGTKLLDRGAVGQLPEVVEGNYPHNNGGCLAQAWSTTEFARVYKLLNLCD